MKVSATGVYIIPGGVPRANHALSHIFPGAKYPHAGYLIIARLDNGLLHLTADEHGKMPRFFCVYSWRFTQNYLLFDNH